MNEWMGNEASQTSWILAWNINLSFLPGERCFSATSLSLAKRIAHHSYVKWKTNKSPNLRNSCKLSPLLSHRKEERYGKSTGKKPVLGREQCWWEQNWIELNHTESNQKKTLCIWVRTKSLELLLILLKQYTDFTHERQSTLPKINEWFFAKSLWIIISSILPIMGRACRNSASQRTPDIVPETLALRPGKIGYKTI